MQALKQSDLKTNLLINSPGGPRQALQLAHGLSFELPDKITASGQSQILSRLLISTKSILC